MAGISCDLFGDFMNVLCKHYPDRLVGSTAEEVREHLAQVALLVEAWPIDDVARLRKQDAAPNLLGACKQLLRVIGDTEDESFDWVHDAIAKAEGYSS